MVFMNFAKLALCGPKGLGSVIITMCNPSPIATCVAARSARFTPEESLFFGRVISEERLLEGLNQ